MARVEVEEFRVSKTCRRCGETYPLTAEHFHRMSKSRDGFHSLCKNCRTKYMRQYQIDNAELLKEKSRTYFLANREVLIKKMSIYNKRRNAERRLSKSI